MLLSKLPYRLIVLNFGMPNNQEINPTMIKPSKMNNVTKYLKNLFYEVMAITDIVVVFFVYKR